MNSREKYEYWLELAEYDIESAKVMLNGGRYMYVAFMCQQSIEKLTKGIYTLFTDNDAPMVHNIWTIFKQLKRSGSWVNIVFRRIWKNLQNHKSFLAELLSYYISGRYPTFKEKISSSIDLNRAKRVLSNTQEVFVWIKSLSQYKE